MTTTIKIMLLSHGYVVETSQTDAGGTLQVTGLEGYSTHAEVLKKLESELTAEDRRDNLISIPGAFSGKSNTPNDEERPETSG